MQSIFRGLRPTVRSLARHRTFAVTTVLVLGLGMGAATSIFTLLDGVVLDPLPYPAADRLVRLKNPVPGVRAGTEWDFSTAEYFFLTAHARTISEVGLYDAGPAILGVAGGRPALRVRIAGVTPTVFDLLGAKPERGRMLDAHDAVRGAPIVAMLSDGFWRRQFGASDAVIGATIDVNDQPTQVIGVMAPDVELPAEPGEALPTATDLWLVDQLNAAGPFDNNHLHQAIGRLASGETAAKAQAELDRLTTELPAQFPSVYSHAFMKRFGFHMRLTPLKVYVVGRVAAYLWILFAAVGLVLAIACANVANLLLVRLEARRREMAVRTALGARWRHLAGDAFREGLVLSSIGASLAVLIAYAATRWLVRLAPSGLPRVANLHVDAGVLMFAGLLAVLVAAVLAAVAAAQMQSASTSGLIGDGGRTTARMHRVRLQSVLVVSRVALALVLVVSAALLLRSFGNLRRVNPGIAPHGLVTVDIALSAQESDSAYKPWRFYSELLSRVRALPGVSWAGLSEHTPFEGDYGCVIQGFEDQRVYQRARAANETTCAGQEPTSPEFFAAMGIPILKGRGFTAADNDAPDRGAAIVSKAFADRFWPGEDAIGKGVGPNGDDKPPFYHVVGVVGDVHSKTVDDSPPLAIYYPIVSMNPGWRWYVGSMTLAVRTTRGDPMSYLPAIRRVVAQLDPGVPLANAQDMTTVVARSMNQLTFTMTLLGVAGITALLLAGVGLYGVISYLVVRRTNEIGVRLALGAQPGQVQGMVVGKAVVLTIVGLGIGALGALASSQVLGALLYGVAPWDPESYMGAAFVLAAVAVFAGWLPARRAAALDPAVALRSE